VALAFLAAADAAQTQGTEPIAFSTSDLEELAVIPEDADTRAAPSASGRR
jgi:hypothetical protein